MLTAEDVQRQVAVAPIVAVEEAALLLAVQRIIGRIQIQPDLPGWLLAGLQEHIHQQSIEPIRIRCDLPVAIPRCRIRRRQLQTVQSARSGQRIAPVTRPLSMLSRQIVLAHQQRQCAVRAQHIVIVEILVAERKAIHPLRHQRLNAVLNALRIPVVGETGREAPQHAEPMVYLPQQEPAAIRGDPTAIEPTHNIAPAQCLKFKLSRYTLCLHRPLPSGVRKCLPVLTLSARERPVPFFR